MPYLLIQSNKAVSETERSRLLSDSLKIVAAALNKPEKYVMAVWAPAPMIFFDGDTKDAVFLEVRSIGIPESARAKMPGALAKCMAENLGVSTDRVFLVMTDVPGKYWAQGEQTFG
jgi:phenylpyruvate tautomerase